MLTLCWVLGCDVRKGKRKKFLFEDYSGNPSSHERKVRMLQKKAMLRFLKRQTQHKDALPFKKSQFPFLGVGELGDTLPRN